MTSRHFEEEQIINKERRLTFRRIVKICVYLIFFLIVLSSAVVSKLSLFTMINAYKTLEQVRSLSASVAPHTFPSLLLLAENLRSPMASPSAGRYARALRSDLPPKSYSVCILR